MASSVNSQKVIRRVTLLGNIIFAVGTVLGIIMILAGVGEGEVMLFFLGIGTIVGSWLQSLFFDAIAAMISELVQIRKTLEGLELL